MTPQTLLREKNMRITPLRRKVLEVLMEKNVPLSHTEIFELLVSREPAPDRVTLYRTLSSFAESGIVHQIQGVDGTLRFGLHSPLSKGCPGNHPHFLCRICGRMSCLSSQPLPRVDVPEGTLVEGKQMVIFGVCSACRQSSIR